MYNVTCLRKNEEEMLYVVTCISFANILLDETYENCCSNNWDYRPSQKKKTSHNFVILINFFTSIVKGTTAESRYDNNCSNNWCHISCSEKREKKITGFLKENENFSSPFDLCCLENRYDKYVLFRKKKV